MPHSMAPPPRSRLAISRQLRSSAMRCHWRNEDEPQKAMGFATNRRWPSLDFRSMSSLSQCDVDHVLQAGSGGGWMGMDVHSGKCPPALRQATKWLSLAMRSLGVPVRHAGCFSRQRAWKAQPRGRPIGLRGSPASGTRWRRSRGWVTGAASCSTCVWWRAGERISSSVGPISAMRPRYVKATRSLIGEQRPRS